MIRKISLLIVLLIVFSAQQIFADIVYLKNGNRLRGIVTKETEKSVELKINPGAKVTFSKDDVKSIDKETEEQRARLEEEWDAGRNKAEVKEITKDVFEEEQLKKGLVKYNEKWVSPEERERLQVANLARDADKDSRERRFSLKEDNIVRSDIAKKLLSRGNWFLRESEHFSVFYRDLAQAKIVGDKAEYYFEKILYDIGREKDLKWDRKCQVFIVENPDKWKVFLKSIGFNADLIGGFVPNYGEKEMFLCAISEGYLALTFPHELTHLIFKEIAGKNTIPLWLNEGLANYEANLTSISNELLMKNIKQGTHILLGDLLRISAYPEGKESRELFYAQSEKLVEFLITQCGREKFKKFCDLLLKDKSFKEAVFSIYAKDFKDIEDFNIKLVEYIVK
ncbi:MAG: peptidase MA family metallohydrolase [Candidatus Omnitrophota bacterium]|nr:peptidase MA family metallohydrolase [Candidatus Omnitrophota bacterium]